MLQEIKLTDRYRSFYLL